MKRVSVASNMLRIGRHYRRRTYIEAVLQSACTSTPSISFTLSRYFSHTFSGRFSFGIAFDIDGVLLQDNKPIEGASKALCQLYETGRPKVPFVFLTNGGGTPESKKALELSELLGVAISENQVLLGHTPFKKLVDSYGGLQTLAVGKCEPANVLTTYGFRNVVSIDEYASQYDHIDPLKRYKSWVPLPIHSGQQPKKKVEAVFVVSDPIDWGRDIQVICDVLRSGGEPEKESGPQPPLYFAADDFLYQSLFPVARFGMGAFRLALENIFSRLTGKPLIYTSFGKPQATVFKDAEKTLQSLATGIYSWMKPPNSDGLKVRLGGTSLSNHRSPIELKTAYMIGDNPDTDILGAKAAGSPWYSILVRTGCFKGKDTNETISADKVVDNVQEAIDFILQREGVC